MNKLLLLSFLASLTAHGAQAPAPRDSLEYRVQRLERLVFELEQRVQELEERDDGTEPAPPAPPPPPPPPAERACMVTADHYMQVFLGKGLTRLQAEANALKACADRYTGTYCKKVVCDPGNKTYQSAFCSFKAKSYETLFSGEGETLIEAEYFAREACQSKYTGAYCSTPPVRCETY